MMKNFKDIKAGDRVRAVYEFTAYSLGTNGDCIGSNDDAWYFINDLVSVEILPPEPKVGYWCMVRDYDDSEWAGPRKIVADNKTPSNRYRTTSGSCWSQAKPVSPELQAALEKEFGK